MPTFGGVQMSDELANLSARPKSSLGQIFTGAAESAIGQLRYGLPYQFDRLTQDQVDPGAEQEYQAGLARAAAAGARAPAAQFSDLTGGRVGLGRFIAENLASSVPYMAGTAVGAAAGGLVGGPGGAIVGAIAAGTPQFSASNVARAVEEQGSLTQESAVRAGLAAPFQSAADAAIGRFLPGAGKVLGGVAATQAGGFLRRTATSIAKAGATEAVTEAGQQVAERYAAGIPTGDADAVAEYVNAAATAFVLGGALGAGGGFRRTPAVAKPAAAVGEGDLNTSIDAVLALPAPADFFGKPDGPPTVNPSGTQQLALPSPAMFAPADFIADSAGRVAPAGPEGERAIVIDQNRPQVLENTFEGNLTPEVRAVLDQAASSAPDSLLASTALSRGLPGAGFEVAPVGVEVPAEAFRPFASEPIADLEAAIKAKTAPADLRAEAEREIAVRTAEAIGQAPLTTDNFQQRVDEAKTGLRGGFVQAVEATNPDELLGKVYDQIFTNADQRSNTVKFAQRLGLLDEKLEPTELAQQVEARRAAEVATVAEGALDVSQRVPSAPAVDVPAAPVAVDPALDAAYKAAGIQRQAAATKLQNLKTPADVFRALASDALPESRGSNVAVTQVEKLARKLGLITDDDAMDVTPLGRQTFLGTSEGLEETVSAAQQQGYAGAQASVFERGARAALGGEAETSFSSVEDFAAYQAGRIWADDFVANATTRTAAQTDAIRGRQAARTTGVAVDREVVASRRQLSPAQVQQRSANMLIDAADLRAVDDTNVAALRRMAREGATPFEVGKAIEQAQGGKLLFRQPEAATARLSPLPTRGQPVFREMATPESQGQKSQQRAQTEAAVRAYDLRNLIEFVRAEKGVTDGQAQHLHDLLDQGKITPVERALKRFDPDAAPRAARRADQMVDSTPENLRGAADAKLEQAVDGKSFAQVLEHMIAEAPSKYMRHVMRAVKAMAGKLEKAGFVFDIQVVHEGDQVPRALLRAGANALTLTSRKPAGAKIWLKSLELGGQGLNYQLIAHEMWHAVGVAAVDYGLRTDVYGTGQIGAAVKDLKELGDAIITHLSARKKSGTLNRFEERFLAGEHNALSDVHELLAWGMTNPEMQRYLQSIAYKPKQSVFGRLVELLRKLLGVTGTYDTALTELLRVSEQIAAAPDSELSGILARNNPDAFGTGAAERAMFESTPGAASAANRTAAAANEATTSAAAMLGKMVENLDVKGLGPKARRIALGWISSNQMDRAYAEQVPGKLMHSTAHRERDAILARVEKLGVDAYQEFEKFERANPNGAEWLGQLMALSTKYHIDPDKAWEEHAHHGFVTDEAGKVTVDPKRAQENAQISKLYAAAQKLKNDLSRGDGQGIKLYSRLRQLNEAQNYMHMASRLHRLVAGDRELMLGVENALINPVDAFMREAGALTDPAAIRDFWLKALDEQVAAVTAFTRDKRSETERSGVDADMRALREHLSPIDLQIGSIAEAKKAIAQGPYFHLGRFGEHFASATIKKGADGKADPTSLKIVAEAIEQGNFGTAEIAADETRPKFSIRFEKKDQADRFAGLLGQLEQQGHLESGSSLVGPRALAGNYGVQEGLPEFVTALLQRVETSSQFTVEPDMSDKEKALILSHKEAVKQDIRDQWLESQPDSAISRVLTKRYAVPGYDPNMMRSFAHRWRVGATHIANTSTAPKFDRAAQSLEAQYRDELQVNRLDAQGNSIPRSDPYVVADITRELRLRDARTAINETVEGLDTLRAVTNVYFLGMSPAYGLINMTQLGVTALPEMAKKHGYTKSFAAMRRASGPALAVIKAVASEARELGWRHYGDVSISDNVLRKAGLDENTRKFVIDMLATGTIDIGSMARALGQISDPRGLGGGVNTGLKLGSMVGLYTETLSRLVTALAARDLHGGYGPDASAYAAHTVSQSMFDYQTWNTARQLGKKGILGPVTPLLAQFMSYQVQLGEKLYAEAMDAAGRAHPGDTPGQAQQRKTEARRFMLGHLTAVTVLAGSLGWPLATVFATIIERLVDALDDDDEPYDATAAWRGFLADTLGKGMGEVVSRGLPRALGFDISSRAGEQNIIPFSEFLADRRPWKEAVESSAGRSLGAAPSMVSNVITGGGKLANGDLLGGLKDMLPVALKAPVEAYRMTGDGYVDSRGNRLPLTPTASSYLWQLLGFSPAEKAEYGEARGDQAARRGEITREAGRLRQQIVKALLTGDQDGVRDLVAQAIEFDADNPAFAVIPSIPSALQRQNQTRARAVGLQAPIGVTMKDVAGQELTRYANVNYTQ
jgi:hypothetical protein